MKAMILAAGKGTRVRPLTQVLPKPMIPILGKPVMEYLVEELARHGFNQIMVNTSHLAPSIENYFNDGRRWGVEIGYSFEGLIQDGEVVAQPVGSAGGMRRIQDFGGFFDDTFLVVCGDALIDLDLTTAVRRHWQSGAAASLVAMHVDKSPGVKLRGGGLRRRRPDYGVPGKATGGRRKVRPREYGHLHFRTFRAGTGARRRRVRYRQPAVSRDPVRRVAVPRHRPALQLDRHRPPQRLLGSQSAPHERAAESGADARDRGLPGRLVWSERQGRLGTRTPRGTGLHRCRLTHPGWSGNSRADLDRSRLCRRGGRPGCAGVSCSNTVVWVRAPTSTRPSCSVGIVWTRRAIPFTTGFGTGLGNRFQGRSTLR
jgi:hypothetical protein